MSSTQTQSHELQATESPRLGAAAGVLGAGAESCGKCKGTAYLAFGILLTEWRLMGETTPLGLRDIHLLSEADPQGKGRDQAT